LLVKWRHVLLWVTAVEVALSVVCVVVLAIGGELQVALWLVGFVMLFNLYSFNYLVPRLGAELRLKKFWWGNLLSAGGGYVAVWMAGLSTHATGPILGTTLAAVLLCPGFDYAVFLGECASDAEEERVARLRTLPAIVGRRGTALVAWVMCLVLGVVAFGFGRVGVEGPFLAWYALSSMGFCSGLLYFATKRRSPALWGRLVDLSFWVIRLGALGILLPRTRS
jgi:hypothetical protein